MTITKHLCYNTLDRNITKNDDKGAYMTKFYKNTQDANSLEIDYNLASSYVNVANSLKKQFKSLKNDFTISSLMKVPDVVRSSQEEQNEEEILPILTKTRT